MQPQVGSGRHDLVVQVIGELGGREELPSQLAHVAHPERPHLRPAGVDLLRGAERERVVAQVLLGQALQEVAGARAHDRQHGEAGRHVGDRGVRGEMLRQPHRRARLRGRGRDHHEPILSEPRDRGVHLDATALVAPCRVDHLAPRNVDVARAHTLHPGKRARPLHHELRVGGQVEQGHALARGAALLRHVVEPVLLAERVAVDGLDAAGREPVRALPPGRFAETRVRILQAPVQGRPAHAAAGLRLQERPVHRVELAERLVRAVVQPRPVLRPAARARHVDVGEVHGGVPLHDPFGQRLARARAVDDALGVEPARHVEAVEPGDLAQQEVRVGREALGRGEEMLEAHGLEGAEALARVGQHGGEVIPVGAELLEAARGDGVHRPWLALRLERAHEIAAAVVPDVEVAIQIPQERERLPARPPPAR